jgi:hypothetical protein
VALISEVNRETGSSYYHKQPIYTGGELLPSHGGDRLEALVKYERPLIAMKHINPPP